MCKFGLQLYWIPIRDWNISSAVGTLTSPGGCNYIESLLGIETKKTAFNASLKWMGCNYIESLLGIETLLFFLQLHLMRPLQLYWIPIRDWNDFRRCSDRLNHKLQLYWIPIRDWNRFVLDCWKVVLVCCNYIESLLGIETFRFTSSVTPLSGCNYIESLLGIETTEEIVRSITWAKGCNYIESLLGIETRHCGVSPQLFQRCNYIESLLGIETIPNTIASVGNASCNYIESLLGIETAWLITNCWVIASLQLYWIPIRDWNTETGVDGFINPAVATILNPY